MLIELYTTQEGTKIYWDTEATNQDPLAIVYINTYCDNNTPLSERREIEVGNPSNYRIIEQNFVLQSIYNIKKTIKYANRIVSPINGEVSNISYNVEEIPQVWHEEDCSMQIVISLEDTIKMLNNKPYYLFAEYCAEKPLIAHSQYGNVYTYANTILPEHYAMFEGARQQLGIIITINTKD